MTNLAAMSAALIAYMVVVWVVAPKRVRAGQFFTGKDGSGAEPTLMLLIASSAISWIFAKSIVNSASLTHGFGLWGGFGYALYYLSFIVVGVAIYLLRRYGDYRSLPDFMTRRYGILCMRLFLLAVGIRLFNEVWSNTKVIGLFFGSEGSSGYWGAVAAFSAFCAAYSIRGGLRGSLVTDGIQMLLAVLLLCIVLGAVAPTLSGGLPETTGAQVAGGMTFAALAIVQSLSYGFHDPVMTDRAFITNPKRMLRAFCAAALVGIAFIFLFGLTGSFATKIGHTGGDIMASITGAVALPAVVVFSLLMLTSAGSTLDSTFTSSSKLAAIDWSAAHDKAVEPDQRQLGRGRVIIAIIAILGNLPLLSLYFGDQIGPAIIKATTISGTMVMGLAPIILLCFIKSAGKVSFHLSFWTGIILGVALAAGAVPETLAVGSGKYALSLGVNLFGLVLCSLLYVAGALVPGQRAASEAAA